jgi:ubiquinone/menaquinone biosynthesis C-methylase UbiE
MNNTGSYFDSKADRYWQDYYVDTPSNHHVLLMQKRRAAILDLIGEEAGMTIELGCGPGVFFDNLPNAKPYVVADLSHEMIRVAVKRGREKLFGGVRLTAQELPFHKEQFDIVIAAGVLEYVLELEKGIAECSRILKKGGIAVISIPSPQPWGKTIRWIGRPFENMARSLLKSPLTSLDRVACTVYHKRYSAFKMERFFSQSDLRVEKRLSLHYFYFPFDTIFFRASQKFDEFLESLSKSIPLISMLAQTHVWKVRKT